MEYFTPKQLAKNYALGIGERLLRDALKDHKHPLPCFRLNNKTILIRRSDFDSWLETYRVDGGARVDAIVDEVMEGLL